ncbi:MAG: mechanosensitive ion channel family protein [Acidimicrobiales bacterium]
MTRRDPLQLRHSIRYEWLVGSISGLVAIAALVVGTELGKISRAPTHKQVIAWVAGVVLLVAGAVAVRHLATALGRLLARSHLGAGANLRLVASGFGYLVLLFALFGVLGVSLQRLLVGAGLAGVILGIAAQQSLGNVFASVVLMIARPFVVGEDIRIRSGVVGVLDVEVLEIGLTYVTVRTDDGVLKIPNSVILASGIGLPHPKPDATSTLPDATPPK